MQRAVDAVRDFIADCHDQFDVLPRHAKAIVGIGVLALPIAAGTYVLRRRRNRPRKSPLKEDWRKDVVYLYQFNPSPYVPNMSPFCLKVETWLRMNGVPFESISTRRIRSMEGQLPFVELNGREICDSAAIIDFLQTAFDKPDRGLTDEQIGASRAIEAMVELNTFWATAYTRYIEKTDEFMSEKVLGFKVPFIYTLPCAKRSYRKMMNTKLYYLGLGRHSPERIKEISCEDVRALSRYLGSKPYMTGYKPTRVDAAVFAVLAQAAYVPIESDAGKLVANTEDAECKNLRQYLDRIKDKFYGADWGKALHEKRMDLSVI